MTARRTDGRLGGAVTIGRAVLGRTVLLLAERDDPTSRAALDPLRRAFLRAGATTVWWCLNGDRSATNPDPDPATPEITVLGDLRPRRGPVPVADRVWSLRVRRRCRSLHPDLVLTHHGAGTHLLSRWPDATVVHVGDGAPGPLASVVVADRTADPDGPPVLVPPGDPATVRRARRMADPATKAAVGRALGLDAGPLVVSWPTGGAPSPARLVATARALRENHDLACQVLWLAPHDDHHAAAATRAVAERTDADGTFHLRRFDVVEARTVGAAVVLPAEAVAALRPSERRQLERSGTAIVVDRGGSGDEGLPVTAVLAALASTGTGDLAPRDGDDGSAGDDGGERDDADDLVDRLLDVRTLSRRA